MFAPETFRKIVSGQSAGIGAIILRTGLRIAAVPYGLGMRIRNARYDWGRARIHRLPIPVICVGNLTLGGTGKTPMVAWLAKWFRARDIRVAIISRGYGAAGDSRNDEALELDQQLPDVPHLQNPDRYAAGKIAAEELATQVVIMDDGFQHRRLHRDLDIVLIDALEPFGHGHLFPRGMLREPVGSLKRADVVALTRAEQVSEQRRASIQNRVRRSAPHAIWLEMSHQPYALWSASGQTESLARLNGTPLATFSGIGNPAGFEQTLAACGYAVRATRAFPDHHAYSADDIRGLIDWARQQDVEAVVCTHKDLVKVGLTELGGKPLWAIAIRMQPLTATDEFERLLTTFGSADE